jgi:hypothetical protein
MVPLLNQIYHTSLSINQQLHKMALKWTVTSYAGSDHVALFANGGRVNNIVGRRKIIGRDDVVAIQVTFTTVDDCENFMNSTSTTHGTNEFWHFKFLVKNDIERTKSFLSDLCKYENSMMEIIDIVCESVGIKPCELCVEQDSMQVS